MKTFLQICVYAHILWGQLEINVQPGVYINVKICNTSALLWYPNRNVHFQKHFKICNKIRKMVSLELCITLIGIKCLLQCHNNTQFGESDNILVCGNIIKRPLRDTCLCMGELLAPPAPPAPAAPPAPHFVFLITL